MIDYLLWLSTYVFTALTVIMAIILLIKKSRKKQQQNILSSPDPENSLKTQPNKSLFTVETKRYGILKIVDRRKGKFVVKYPNGCFFCRTEATLARI